MERLPRLLQAKFATGLKEELLLLKTVQEVLLPTGTFHPGAIAAGATLLL